MVLVLELRKIEVAKKLRKFLIGGKG